MRFTSLLFQSLQQLHDSQRTLEVELLITDAFEITRSQFWILKDQEITDEKKIYRFQSLFNRLLRGEPLSYIRKKKEFYSRDFYVNKHVLIPRPETEILVEKAIESIDQNDHVLDVGSGSGNIALTLAQETCCHVMATEISFEAIQVLQKNICLHRQEKRVETVLTDLFPAKPNQFSVIVSNPPYLSIREWNDLPDHIKFHEPRSALVAGEKGTEIIERIIEASMGRLIEKGRLFLEIGAGQREIVDAALRTTGYSIIEWYQDYQNIDRVVSTQKK